jgi:hypothetical protein
MKVTDDPFYRGLIKDPVFGHEWGPMTMSAAYRIYCGIGIASEHESYTFEEYRWACRTLGKPCKRTPKDFQR